MTNPDLIALANELDDIETDAGGKCNWSEVATVSSALRRLASSDGGVKGEPEPVAWPANLNPRTLDLVQRFALALAKKLRLAEEKYGHTDGWWRDDWEAECRDHLYQHLEKGDPRDVAAYCAFMWHHGWITYRPVITAPPPDAGMREALERAHGKFCKIAGTENWTDSCLDGWRRSPGALRDYAEQAAKEIDAALTAPGATKKSDGIVESRHEAVATHLPSGDVEAALVAGADGPAVGVAPGPSDPSSTRSEVTVEELARYLDPPVFNNNPVVRHRYCSPLRVDVCQSRLIDRARALLDQFEIRRK